ncbi:MAG: hypothetical protein HHJ12_05585 [Glaciimonas sp.]|nr:hypothetical protein [Glaciimonas sp.]
MIKLLPDRSRVRHEKPIETVTVGLATLAEKKVGKNIWLACQTLVLGDAMVKPA